MYSIENIKNYILFLKSECGLNISLHPCADESLITLSELMTFNIHDNPYCVYIKTFDGAFKHCRERQCKVREKSVDGSFSGKCYAGVFEFIYPIKAGDKHMGFISVSGYKAENAESFIKRTSDTYRIPHKNLKEAYFCLSDKIPEKKWVDTLIAPLSDMLELAYVRAEGSKVVSQSVIDRVLRYAKQYHTQNITLSQVAEELGYSRSFISHSFKMTTGQSFREHLTELRLDDAKSLLKYSGLSITEIAYSVGFGDTTYFSNVFKKKFGTSPSEYRRKVLLSK